MNELLDIMRRLRDPEHGCPWDVEQNFATIAPYTIEEAYEVADAIQREDFTDLEDELGDLLLQVVFHSQMADEAGLFSFKDVAGGISEKLVRRHPHVFGDQDAQHADEVMDIWEAEKAREREGKGDQSLMDGVTAGLPELLRAHKLQKKAAKAGFDWPDAEPVLDKLDEEMDEIRDAMESGDADALREEVGDLLFAVVNLARKLKVDSGRALREANAKFEQRFRAMEQESGGTAAFSELDLEAQEAVWQTVKRKEQEHE